MCFVFAHIDIIQSRGTFREKIKTFLASWKTALMTILPCLADGCTERQIPHHNCWLTCHVSTRIRAQIWNGVADCCVLQSACSMGGQKRRQSCRNYNCLNREVGGESNPVWASFSSNGTLTSPCAVLDCTGKALSRIYHCTFSCIQLHLAIFKPTNQPCLKGAKWVDHYLSCL